MNKGSLERGERRHAGERRHTVDWSYFATETSALDIHFSELNGVGA